MKKKGGSIAGGFLVLLLGIGLLWWNEGNNVSNLRSVSEGLKNYVDVSSTEVDNENEGKLVATSGKITFNLPASDSEFEITSNSAVLMRKAEMYQWRKSVKPMTIIIKRALMKKCGAMLLLILLCLIAW